MPKVTKRAKGDGSFFVRGKKIYVSGKINGKHYRMSTGKTYTSTRLAWYEKQDPLKVLNEILDLNKDTNIETSLKEIGLRAITIKYNANREMTLNHHEDKLAALENKILPYLGQISMENISSNDVVSWINVLKEKYSYTHIKFVKGLLNSIFNYAMKDMRVIEYNPLDTQVVKSIDLSWYATTDIYTTSEVFKILTHARGWFKVFTDLSCKYGFRPGEMIALKWEDIDFENGFLYLRRSRNADGKIVTPNKNKRVNNKNHYRLVALQPSTVQLLKEYSKYSRNPEWLFVNKNNEPFSKSQSVINYHLKPLLKKLDIPYKTLYALRRSFASIYKYSGVDLEDIQQVMGHAKGSNVTEKHYITDNVLTVEDRQTMAKKDEELFYKELGTEK